MRLGKYPKPSPRSTSPSTTLVFTIHNVANILGITLCTFLYPFTALPLPPNLPEHVVSFLSCPSLHVTIPFLLSSGLPLIMSCCSFLLPGPRLISHSICAGLRSPHPAHTNGQVSPQDLSHYSSSPSRLMQQIHISNVCVGLLLNVAWLPSEIVNEWITT